MRVKLIRDADKDADMEKASVDSLENHSRSSDVRKLMTDALNLADFSMNYFELEPGESFSGGMHTHMKPRGDVLHHRGHGNVPDT